MEADLQGEWSTYVHDSAAVGGVRHFIGGQVAHTQALTLLEFLVKNGSERVVDDARAHISTIKMLRSFHYIDEKGKDQGINGECGLDIPLRSASHVSSPRSSRCRYPVTTDP